MLLAELTVRIESGLVAASKFFQTLTFAPGKIPDAEPDVVLRIAKLLDRTSEPELVPRGRVQDLEQADRVGVQVPFPTRVDPWVQTRLNLGNRKSQCRVDSLGPSLADDR